MKATVKNRWVSISLTSSSILFHLLISSLILSHPLSYSLHPLTSILMMFKGGLLLLFIFLSLREHCASDRWESLKLAACGPFGIQTSGPFSMRFFTNAVPQWRSPDEDRFSEDQQRSPQCLKSSATLFRNGLLIRNWREIRRFACPKNFQFIDCFTCLFLHVSSTGFLLLLAAVAWRQLKL